MTSRRRPNALGQVPRPGRNALGQVPGLGQARRAAQRIQAPHKAQHQAEDLLALTRAEGSTEAEVDAALERVAAVHRQVMLDHVAELLEAESIGRCGIVPGSPEGRITRRQAGGGGTDG